MQEIIVSDLTVDLEQRKVFRGKEEIYLTNREYEVLSYLAKHKEQIVTREELLKNVWECDYNYFSNVVDVYIRFLRAKIDDNHAQKLIRTHRKRGYSLGAA